MVALAVVRSLGSARSLRSPQELEDFEQELVDQYALALVGSGIKDRQVASERGVLFEFVGFLGRPVWSAGPEDADRFLTGLRRAGQAHSTVQFKAWTLQRFCAERCGAGRTNTTTVRSSSPAACTAAIALAKLRSARCTLLQ